jgi:hypothetical protein
VNSDQVVDGCSEYQHVIVAFSPPEALNV